MEEHTFVLLSCSSGDYDYGAVTSLLPPCFLSMCVENNQLLGGFLQFQYFVSFLKFLKKNILLKTVIYLGLNS